MRAAAAQQRAASMEREHPVLVHVGRVGWFAKGIVYVLAGVLVDTVALRHWRALPVVPNGDEASPTGAVVGISRPYDEARGAPGMDTDADAVDGSLDGPLAEPEGLGRWLGA